MFEEEEMREVIRRLTDLTIRERIRWRKVSPDRYQYSTTNATASITKEKLVGMWPVLTMLGKDGEELATSETAFAPFAMPGRDLDRLWGAILEREKHAQEAAKRFLSDLNELF